jgi:hypothetical protein
MREACYCGRIGEIEDRLPVVDDEGKQALRCPTCGHLDRLEWLMGEARRFVVEASDRRRQPPAA